MAGARAPAAPASPACAGYAGATPTNPSQWPSASARPRPAKGGWCGVPRQPCQPPPSPCGESEAPLHSPAKLAANPHGSLAVPPPLPPYPAAPTRTASPSPARKLGAPPSTLIPRACPTWDGSHPPAPSSLQDGPGQPPSCQGVGTWCSWRS